MRNAIKYLRSVQHLNHFDIILVKSIHRLYSYNQIDTIDTICFLSFWARLQFLFDIIQMMLTFYILYVIKIQGFAIIRILSSPPELPSVDWHFLLSAIRKIHSMNDFRLQVHGLSWSNVNNHMT